MSVTIQSTSSPESPQLIRDFLNTHHSGVLATASRAGTPHAATVYFSLADDYSLIFATKTETQKFKNIEENDEVAFVCYNEAAQTTAQISGKAEVLTDDSEEYRAALNAMYEYSAELSKSGLPPAEKLFAGDYKAIRIVPQVIKMAIFLRPDSEGYDTYETMTFSGN